MRRRRRKKLTTTQRDRKTYQYAEKTLSFQRKVPRATLGYPCKAPIGDAQAPSYEKWMKELYGY